MGKFLCMKRVQQPCLNQTTKASDMKCILIDLQKIIPDSAATCQGIVPFHLTDNIPSNIEYTYYSDLADIHFNPHSLYDTLFLNFSKEHKGNSEIFSIGRGTEPLNNPIEITLKQLEGFDHSKMSVYHMEGRSYEFIGGTWQRDRIQFTTSRAWRLHHFERHHCSTRSSHSMPSIFCALSHHG